MLKGNMEGGKERERDEGKRAEEKKKGGGCIGFGERREREIKKVRKGRAAVRIESWKKSKKRHDRKRGRKFSNPTK